MNTLMIYHQYLDQQKNEEHLLLMSKPIKNRALDRAPNPHELSMPAAGRSRSYLAQTASSGHGRPTSSQFQRARLVLCCRQPGSR